MYEPNDPECNLICRLRARDDETLEIMTPECGGRMPMSAPCFQPFHRRVPKLRLHRVRPTLHMLIQRRLGASEERSLNGRDGGLHQKLPTAVVPQRNDADTHTLSDRNAN